MSQPRTFIGGSSPASIMLCTVRREIPVARATSRGRKVKRSTRSTGTPKRVAKRRSSAGRASIAMRCPARGNPRGTP